MLLPGTPSDDVGIVLDHGDGDVTTVFASMATRHPDGTDADYLQWHGLDHRPEQHRLSAVRALIRLESTPRCRAATTERLRPVLEKRWAANCIEPLLAAALTALTLVSGCTTGAGTQAEPRTSPTSTVASTTATTTTGPVPVPTAPPTRMVNWFDLDVGDCLADPPPTDPNVITVPLVDCATAHQAEVYLRSPLAVNTALADVADRDCNAGFTKYTGQQAGSSPLAVSYLIDSNQNRTSSNPDPSTVICLLQPASGQPLTGSAKR
jgi:hypothetical protein